VGDGTAKLENLHGSAPLPPFPSFPLDGPGVDAETGVVGRCLRVWCCTELFSHAGRSVERRCDLGKRDQIAIFDFNYTARRILELHGDLYVPNRSAHWYPR
jgi:hypothetical protein